MKAVLPILFCNYHLVSKISHIYDYNQFYHSQWCLFLFIYFFVRFNFFDWGGGVQLQEWNWAVVATLKLGGWMRKVSTAFDYRHVDWWNSFKFERHLKFRRSFDSNVISNARF